MQVHIPPMELVEVGGFTGTAGTPIDFTMFGRAIAEFEFTLMFANA